MKAVLTMSNGQRVIADLLTPPPFAKSMRHKQNWSVA